MRRFLFYTIFITIVLAYGKPAIESIFNKVEQNKSAIEMALKQK